MAAVKDYEVFISYRHKDNDKAKRLHDMLQTQYDIMCFRDEEELHFGDFRRQLIRCNRRSKYLVLLVTEETFKRCHEEGDWITKEIELFLKRGKPIIPVLIGGAEIPEQLPAAIEGVKKYRAQAIVCRETEAMAVGRFVSSELCRRLRPQWTERDLADSPSRRRYLSRENVEKNGYFYTTAMTFRRYAALLPLLAIAVVGMILARDNQPMAVAALILIAATFAELKCVGDEKMPIVDVLLDRSIFSALRMVLLPWLLGQVILAAIVAAASLAVSAVLMWVGLAAEVSAGSPLAIALIAPIVALALGARLISKLVFSAIHFGNCLLGRYPASLYRYWTLERWNKRMRVIGWVLLVPAAVGAVYLVLASYGIL